MRTLSFRELQRGIIPQLRREGVADRDAKMAVTLVSLIRWFDTRIFGLRDNAPILLSRQKLNLFAAYQYLPDRGSRYAVFVDNIARTIVREARASQFFISRSSGQLQVLPSSVRVPEYLIAIAAHEVRHRLQGVGAIRKMFSLMEEPSESSNGLLRLLWGIEKIRHPKRIEKLVDAKCDVRIIANEMREQEFDARIVEQMVMHRYYACKAGDELIDLVLLEPETAKRQA